MLLLSVRQTDDTFDSSSDLLFDLPNVLKPNFLRMDELFEVFDVIDAEFADLARL